MLRDYAKIGSVLKLYDSDGAVKRLTITEIKGEGGSCLVYGAKSPGGLKSVIKEFFPLLSQDYSFTRTDGELFIEKSVSVSEDFLLKEHRFVSSVSLMNKLAFSEETAEETLPAELLSNQNGIPYIMNEWNPQRVSCYEDVETSSLNEIATVCLHLSEITLAYHSMGLVHLDIKPSNILWSKKYHYIKLFDFDTINTLESSAQAYRLRGTDGFDAPEVEDHSMVNTKSDVYSIGAILFERVMGRPLNSTAGDRVSFGYEKTLPEMSLIVGEAPEAKALVKTILRGTICAAPGKRMNIAELKEMLSQLVKLTQTEEETDAEKVKPSFADRHKAAVIAAALCSALLLVCGTIFMLMRRFNNSVPVSDNLSLMGNSAAAELPEPVILQTNETNSEAPPENVSEQSAEAEYARRFSDEAAVRNDAAAEADAEPETTAPSTSAATSETSTQHTVRTTAPQSAAAPVSAVETLPRESAPEEIATEPETGEAPAPSEGFSYAIYEEGIELTAYDGSGGQVVIPQSINGCKVIKLGDDLFSNRNDITSFVVPEGIRELGYGVFRFCTRITEIKLPDSLEIIRSNALYGLWGMHEVFIPKNVYQIDGLTFGGWSGFDNIEVSEDNKWFCSVDGVLYNNRKTKLLFYPAYKSDKEFTIPDTVANIEVYAFDRPRYLEKLNIPASVSNIDPNQIFGSIKEFTLDPSNSCFTLYDGALFSKDMTSLLSYPAGSPREEWTVPSCVKRLECGSISLAYNLRTLIVLQMPEYIGEVAINDYHELHVSYNDTLYTPEEFYSLYRSMTS